MQAVEIKDLAVAALEDLKAVDVCILEVGHMTSVMDYMVIASGNSDRHVKSLIMNVVETAKKNGIQPLGIEGETEAQWALVDLGDVVVHVMLPKIRDFYQLEKLWSVELPGEVKGS